MQIYKQILITMDCSPVDDAIIEHVSALALQNNSIVSLIHIIHSHTIEQDRALHKDAKIFLNEKCKLLQSKGIETHIILKSGEPEEEIVSVINNGEFDLVAMATHGHGFFGDTLFGSVSRVIKHKTTVPLLIIGPQTK